MRREAEFFNDRELELVFIAKRLRDALRLEKAFSSAGIEYAVQTENYIGGLLFRSERVGAFFYVEPHEAAHARSLVTSAGLRSQTED